MWWEVSLLLVGFFLGQVAKLLDLLFDRFKARTTAEYWEAQERWKLKANTYSRVLSALRRMRADLEIPAARGEWPERDEMKNLIEHSNELTEPVMLARLWLPDESTQGLETLGDRLLKLREEKIDSKTQLMKACEILQDEINRVVAIAREDIKIQGPKRLGWSSRRKKR